MEALVHHVAKVSTVHLMEHFPVACCLWDLLSTPIFKYMHTPRICLLRLGDN